MISEINESDFKTKVLESKVPVLVDFYATWCGPCKIQAEVLNRLAAKNIGNTTFVKIDVDKNEEFASSLGIQAVPTLILYKDGEEYLRVNGARNEEEIKRLLTL